MDPIGDVKTLIRTPCKSVELVPFDVQDYLSVVNLWVAYKRGDNDLEICPTIQSYFDFHKNHEPHVLLYSSRLLEDVLLMGKVGGRYINIRAPRIVDLSAKPSFIAVYASSVSLFQL